MTKTFVIEGNKVRTTTQRRYVVVIGRNERYEGQRWDYRTQQYEPVSYAPVSPEIVKRSDNLATARRDALSRTVAGGYVAIVDTDTGQQVS